MALTFREAVSYVEFDKEVKSGDLVLVRQELRQLDQNQSFGGKVLKKFLSPFLLNFLFFFSQPFHTIIFRAPQLG